MRMEFVGRITAKITETGDETTTTIAETMTIERIETTIGGGGFRGLTKPYGHPIRDLQSLVSVQELGRGFRNGGN